MNREALIPQGASLFHVRDCSELIEQNVDYNIIILYY